jgi:cell division protein FtsN
MDIKEKILIALGLDKEEEIKLGWQSKGEDGTIYVSTAEELEAGVDVSVLTEDGTTIPLPVGTYKTDTGVSFRVEEEGVVGEVIESETEEEIEAEDDKEEMTSEELAKEDDEYDEEADVADWQGMEKRIKNLEDAVSDLKRQIGETGDVEEMSEETVEDIVEEKSSSPKTVTTKTTEVVEFSVEELKAENKKLKEELAKTPAEAPINTNKFSSERPVLSRKQYNKLSKQERFLYNLNK